MQINYEQGDLEKEYEEFVQQCVDGKVDYTDEQVIDFYFRPKITGDSDIIYEDAVTFIAVVKTYFKRNNTPIHILYVIENGVVDYIRTSSDKKQLINSYFS